MSLSRRAYRWLGTSVLGIAALVGVLLSATYFYIESDGFRQNLSKQLSTLSGQGIEFGDAFVLRTLLPSPTIALPNARLLSSQRGVRRARIEGLEITLSPGMLLSSGRRGEISLSADRLSVIADGTDVDAGEVASDADASVTSVSEVVAAPDLVELLAPVLDGMASRQVNVTIGALDLIVRDAQEGSSRYALSDVAIHGVGEQIVLEGTHHGAGDESHRARLVVSELVRDRTPTRERITGRINLDVSRLAEAAATWQFAAALQVEPHAITLPDFDLKSTVAWLRGQVKVQSEAGTQRLEADLELRRLEMAGLMTASTADEPAPEKMPGRVFTPNAPAFTLPASLQAEVRLRLGAVRMGGVPLASGQMRLTVDAGKANLVSDGLTILGGPSEIQIDLDNTSPTRYALRLRLEATAMQLARLRAGIDQEAFISQGEADLLVALKGAGASSAEIAGALNGYVLGAVNDAEINQKYSTLIDRGLVSWARQRFSLTTAAPTLKGPGQPPVEPDASGLSDALRVRCGALRLYINNGRAEASNGLVLELPDNTLYSSGYVDLAAEDVAFAFRTRSRSLFDWSVISIIKYVEVSGSLANPTVRLNAMELAKQGLLSASSVAWGPLPSLVYSLAESGVQNSMSRECDVSLRR